jgi:pimeloyl-ACP methyl ester carboxylesterase
MSDAPSARQALLVSGAAEDEELWSDVLGQLLPGAITLTLPSSSDLKVLSESVLGTLRDALHDGAGEPQNAGVLVGHSLGGAACVLAANRAPELVGGLVVVASGVSMPVHPSLWGILADGGESAVIRRFAGVSGSGSDGHERPSADVSPRMQTMMQRATPGTLTNHLKACDAYRAPTVSVPATVIAGADDRLVSPDLCEQLAERIGARYELVPDAGHQVPWERPERIVDAIKALSEPKSGF